MCKISVVIPVYKVGKFIENSMKSVCNQTFKDFEVVLVDNNTPDDSIEIAEKVLRTSSVNYRVIRQTKQGLPAARNKGIAEAKGEWIISIDPDDTISSYFLSELYSCATQYSLDFVFSKYGEVESDKLFDFPEETLENAVELYDKADILHLLLVRKVPLMISNMFFNKRTFVENGYQFEEDVILGADLIALWRILLNVKKIAYVNKILYNHFFRPDSLMTAPSWEKIESNLMGYDRLCKYVREQESETLSKWIYARSIYGFVAPLCIYGNKKSYKEYLRLYYDTNVHSILQTFPDKKIRLLDLIIKVSPTTSYYIHKVLRNPNSVFWKLISRFVNK